MRSKWICLAVFGLLAGAVCPHLSFGGDPQHRQWIDAVNPVDGKTYRISGWLDVAGSAHFDPREYPQFVARPAPLEPAPASPSELKAPAFAPPTGVIQSKVPRPVAGQAWYGGNAVKVIEADGRTPKARPPDVHLTVIGVEAEQVKARAKLQADPQFRALEASMGDRLAVQFYGPTDPMVARVGLVDGGKPDVVIQTADGKERKRFHTDPGPTAIIQEIRKADPDYKPGRDDATSFDLPGLAYPLIGVVAVGAWLLFQRSKTVPS